MIKSSNITKGSLLAIIAFFFMAVFGILTKLALQDASFIWVSFLAYLSGTLLMMILIAPEGIGYLKSDHYLFLFGRAIFGCTASFLYTISLNYISIVNGTLLFNTAPIFIPLLTVLFLKTKIEKSIWFAVAIGFLGIIIIIKPTAEIFTQRGNLIAVASGLSLAIAYLLMKLLSSTDPAKRIILYYLGIGMLIQVPLLFMAGPLPAYESIFYALASGITLVIAQMCLIEAYKYANASQIGVYQYMSVVFVGLLNWILWGAIPNGADLLGIILVVIAGLIIIRSN